MSRSLAFLAAALLAAALVPVAAGGASAASSPSCAEGPVREGDTILGTPCADVIVAPPTVATVRGGGGNDTIVAAAVPAALESEPGVFLDVGSQTFEGGPGDDVVYGQRGNDTLKGGAGNDRLYGGIGDDLLLGGPGDDLLSGGFGADTIDGEDGSDYVRGDGTIDRIRDSGGPGDADTLSYSTGVTPGFSGAVGEALEEAEFPGPEGERGLRLLLDAEGLNAFQGIAADGGGVDEVQAGAFENVIGTPFADILAGSGAGETFYGGGGADAIEGEAPEEPRDTTRVSVGFMVPDQSLGAQLYLVGSDGADEVVATYSATAVVFTLGEGSEFDVAEAEAAGCEEVEAREATCELKAPLDSVLLAGMGGDDAIEASGFPASTGVVLIGGEGSDRLSGGNASEDVLVDGRGPGADTLAAGGGDDALLHNGGPDLLDGGDGNDLFLSTSACDGETLAGGTGRDNASWARLPAEGVEARLDLGLAGEPGAGAPACAAGAPDALREIEDLEGSGQRDVLYGDAGPNQLLGRGGPDDYRALAGEDRILANSGDADPVIDCGADADVAIVDRPQYGDAAPVECETVKEADPNDFQNATLVVPPAPPPPDTTPPRTRITHRPAHLLTVRRGPRRVAFAFAADEAGSRFRCRLDHRPYGDCASPRRHRVGLGRHVFRVFAVDPAGNRDASPARAVFRVRRLVVRTRSHHSRRASKATSQTTG